MLNEQLQNELDQEARVEAKKITGRVPIYRMGYQSGHYDGAEKYAEKWQEEKELRERYEKALREIQAKCVFPKTENEAGIAIYDILKICNGALTPKTSTDA